MATIASEAPEARHRLPPISLHPAFPAIVALWLAVLLGLGSLVLPGVLLERAVAATGLASAIPAAAPPLGLTARAAIGLVAALSGAALGIFIGRRVASAQAGAAKAPASRAGFGARRPINILEELGGDGLTNGHALPLSGGRAQLIADDDQPDPAPPASLSDADPFERSHVTEDGQALPDEVQAMTEEQDFLSPLVFQDFAEPAAPIDSLQAQPAEEAAAEMDLIESELVLERGLVAAAEEEDEDAEDAAPDFSFQIRQPAAAPEAHADSAEEEEEDEGVEDSAGAERFRSLLAMRSAGASEKKFVRMDQDEQALDAEPAGTEAGAQRLFDPPGEEPADTPSATPLLRPDTDAALRAALATLQRISGAA